MVKGRHNEEVRVVYGEETQEQVVQEEVPVLTAAQPAVSTEVVQEQVPVLTAAQPATAPAVSAVSEVEKLRLYEERAQVEVQRAGIGQVQIRKVVRERQEMVPVTIQTEVLEIVVNPVAAGTSPADAGEAAGVSGIHALMIDGKPLGIGQSYEIPLTEERIQVVKQVYAINDVTIRKQAHTTTHQETVTLRREELDVKDEGGLARIVDLDTPRQS